MPGKGKQQFQPTQNYQHQQQQQQQQQQRQQHHPQQPQRVIIPGTEYHVPQQNYGGQPGGQVGGGGNSVGVPGGRGPPPLGSIQNIGQTATGIQQQGGQTGAQQPPPQSQTPGVQSQQPQGPPPTTTPPVHTPPQEMGKQAHLQAQSLQQGIYVANQTRPATQVYYPAGARQQAPRGVNHRGSQGGGGAQVVGMQGVGGGGGQQTAMYPHPGALPVPPGAVYMQGQVPLHPSHAGPHQQSVYTMNSQTQSIQFPFPPQRHQGQHNQSFYPSYQPTIVAPNIYGFVPAPTTQHAGFYYAPQGPGINLSRAAAGAVTGGAQHVGTQLPGGQGAAVVQQGGIQQPPQQPQPLQAMALPLGQPDVYQGHNGGGQNSANNSARNRKQRRTKAILDIVDPKTGKNISEEIYDDDAATQSGGSSNRATPQPQNCGMEMIADFAARVAKAATEGSDSGSPAPSSAPDTPTPTPTPTSNHPPSQTITNVKQIQTSPDIDNSQCNINTGGGRPILATTQSIPPVVQSPVSHQSLVSSVSTTQSVPVQADHCVQSVTDVKPKEHKPLQTNVKEFQPRNDVKIVSEEPPQQIPVVINQKITSPQLSKPAPVSSSPPVVKAEPEPAPVQITPVPTPTISQTTSIVTPADQIQSVPVATTNSNPVPSKEDFPSLEPKVPINSPARRKQGHQSVADMPFANAAKEPKERKLSEKNSRGTTPTPNVNQADHHHPKPNGDTIDKHDQEPVSKNDQRPADGKANPKAKKRNQLKNRDLNRKGAEKEGTDMDAFVNAVQPAKPETTKQQTDTASSKQQDSKESSPHPNDTEKESAKDIKDEENIESKKEADAAAALALKIEQAVPESSKETTPIQTPTTEKVATIVQNNKESSKESSPTIEDTPRIQEVCKMPVKTVANDVVDHSTAVVDDSEIESAIVAQKNEENSKVSALRATSEEEQDNTEVIDKDNETEEKDEDTPKGPPPLKYTYSTEQWSPLNVSGKKVYDREFLMQLQADPSSRIKPTNLPDLEVVLKDNSRNRGVVDIGRFKESGMENRHANLFPGFVKSQSTRGPLAPKRGSQQGKAKNSGGPKVIHVSLSLREDVKLRETENAWKPGRMKPSDADEEQLKTEALYKKVRGVLNKLTPQKFNTLVNQVRALQIDSQERLQGVIDLVFEKAVDEPSFSVAYALMCKELAQMQVSSSDTKAGKEESGVNFRKLIITRCQTEFEKNTVDENARAIKIKEIEANPDPDKRKELMHILNEEERKIRVKSVGNIRFIGELFKQGMLTTNIMHRCIRHLLTQIDEESLECLCKLLSTVGKDLESKGQPLDAYFKQMLEIVNRKGPGKVSSRVRFMLQDVVELRLNKWVPRRDDSNPKTMDQIQKEAETERLDAHLNNTPMNTPRKDDRNSDRKRNRGGGPTEEGGWSAPVRSSRTQYSVETSKLKNKPPPMDNLQLGNKNMFQWSRNVSTDAPKTVNKYAMLENINSEQDKRSLPLSGSRSTGPREYGRQDYKSSYDGRHSRNGSQQLNSRSSSRDSSLHDSSRSQSMSMPPPQIKSIPPTAPVSTPVKSAPRLTEEQLAKKAANILEEYLSDTNVKNAALEVRETFDDTTFAKFVTETLNDVVEKSATARKQVSQLMTHLLSTNILPLPLYLAGLAEVLELAEDLVIDIPKIWVYLAELIWYPLAEGVHPFSELKTTMAPLKSKGLAGKLMGELMIVLIQEKTPKWIKDKWDESGLQWSDFMPESESKDFIKKYKLEFLFGDGNSSSGSLSAQLNMEQIHERLRSLISNEKEYSYENVVSWISANVGDRAKEPQFIRVLMTAILEVSIEPYNQTWKFKVDKFQNLRTLIYRYIDTNDLLELNCLIAIQEYIHKLEHPSGVLLQVIEKLSDANIVSDEAFLAWESNKDPTTQTGKSVAMMALTSFFTSLKEAEDDSTSDEA